MNFFIFVVVVDLVAAKKLRNYLGTKAEAGGDRWLYFYFRLQMQNRDNYNDDAISI